MGQSEEIQIAHITLSGDRQPSKTNDSTDECIRECIPHLDIDKIWRIVGRGGQYQVRQFILVFFYGLGAGCHLFSYVFLGYEPPHVCSQPDNITDLVVRTHNISHDDVISFEKCSIVVSDGNESNPEKYSETSCLHGNNYSFPRSTSALSEWDYVCDKRDLGQIPQSVLMAGQGLGALLTFMADYFGRKKTLIFSEIGIFLASFSVAFVWDFWLFTTLRFFTGAFQQGIVLAAWIYMVELVPKEHRFISTALFNMAFAISFFVLAAAAYFVRNYTWRALAITVSFTSLHAIFVFFFMEESLRWLIVKNRTEGALRVIKKICRQNKIPLEKILLADTRGAHLERILPDSDALNDIAGEKRGQDLPTEELSVCERSETVSEETRTSDKERSVREGFVAFLKDPKLLCHSFVIWFAWFVNVLVYFGLVMVPSVTVSNRFLQFAINGFMELPVPLLLWLTVTKFQRRTACVIIHLVAGLGLMSSTILNSLTGTKDDYFILIMILALIGGMAIRLSFNFLFLYTPELFPTYLRNTGTGVASFCGRFGGVIAPFSVTLANRVSWAPGVIFATGCFIVSFLVKFVPETGDKELPQKTEDIKTWQTSVN